LDLFQVLASANLARLATYLIVPAARDAISNSRLGRSTIHADAVREWTTEVFLVEGPGPLFIRVNCHRTSASSRLWNITFPVSSLYPEMGIVSEVMES
jgi:hypothetical protein